MSPTSWPDCHTSWGHKIAGSRYQANAADTLGIDVPGHTDFGRASCQSCRGGVATKVWWDWSTAGRLDGDGQPITEYDEQGHPSYLSEKGDFRHAENVVPTYAWFDGTVKYTLVDEQLDVDNPPISINQVEGSPEDPDSRIWPFKVMEGKQPYDTELETLLATHVFGADDSSLWSNFSWPKALQAGSEMSGMPFSGHYDFIETRMYWPITHMVPPADQALKCSGCHAANSRLAGLPGIYMPGYSSNIWLDRIGWALVALTLSGVLLHGLARLLLKGRKRS